MNIINFEEIKKEFNIATKNVTTLRKNLSEVDKLENEILHQLEAEDRLSACDGYKFAKALKDVRVKRRSIKEVLKEQEIISDKLKPFVSSYEDTMKNITDSSVKGKKKYVKNFSDINIKLAKINKM